MIRIPLEYTGPYRRRNAGASLIVALCGIVIAVALAVLR